MSTPLLELEGTTEEIQKRLDDFAGQRLHIVITQAENPAEATPDAAPRQLTIEEKILARFSHIPSEERANIPADLSDNLDHYLYGWPTK